MFPRKEAPFECQLIDPYLGVKSLNPHAFWEHARALTLF